MEGICTKGLIGSLVRRRSFSTTEGTLTPRACSSPSKTSANEQVREWSDNYDCAYLVVDISLFDRFDDDTLKVIKDAVHQVSRVDGDGIDHIDVLPKLITEQDWRADLTEALAGKPSNQARLARLPERHPVVDHMRFRSTAEVCLYEALKRLQGQLPKDETIAIVPNASVRVRGHTWEPDFLVTYKRRCGVIEGRRRQPSQEVRRRQEPGRPVRGCRCRPSGSHRRGRHQRSCRG